MPQMLRLSQGHWLNLDEIVSVHDEPPLLVVACKHSMTHLRLKGEKRDSLLAWLAHHGQVWSVSRPEYDNPFEETTETS